MLYQTQNFEAALNDLFTQQAEGKAQALDLCKRLAEDDAFRVLFVCEPIAILAQYGFRVDAADLPEAGIKLPSKEVMAKHLDLIASRFAESQSTILQFGI